MIQENRCGLTSAGATILENGRHLPPKFRVMFVTGGILALNAFIAHPNINIMVVGEHVNKESTITLRAVAIEKIEEDKC